MSYPLRDMDMHSISVYFCAYRRLDVWRGAFDPIREHLGLVRQSVEVVPVRWLHSGSNALAFHDDFCTLSVGLLCDSASRPFLSNRWGTEIGT